MYGNFSCWSTNFFRYIGGRLKKIIENATGGSSVSHLNNCLKFSLINCNNTRLLGIKKILKEDYSWIILTIIAFERKLTIFRPIYFLLHKAIEIRKFRRWTLNYIKRCI